MASELILWKPLYKTTVVLYVSIFLLALPAPQLSILALFALIAVWSRVPALMTLFTKDVEVVDIFTVMTAVYYSSWVGALFGSGIILFTRLFGPTEPLDYTIKESICFFVGSFTAPVVYYITNGNLTITMFSFTFVRYTLPMVISLLINPGALVLDISLVLMNGPTMIMFNLFILNVFGDFFSHVFEKGAVLNVSLLAVATGIVGVIFLFSRFLEREEQKRMAQEIVAPSDRQLDLGMAGSLALAQEPWEAFLELFSIQEESVIVKITKRLFSVVITIILSFFLIATNYNSGKQASIFVYIVVIAGIFALVYLTTTVLEKYLLKKERQFPANVYT